MVMVVVTSCSKGVLKRLMLLFVMFSFSFQKWLAGVGDYMGQCIGIYGVCYNVIMLNVDIYIIIIIMMMGRYSYTRKNF